MALLVTRTLAMLQRDPRRTHSKIRNILRRSAVSAITAEPYTESRHTESRQAEGRSDSRRATRARQARIIYRILNPAVRTRSRRTCSWDRFQFSSSPRLVRPPTDNSYRRRKIECRGLAPGLSLFPWKISWCGRQLIKRKAGRLWENVSPTRLVGLQRNSNAVG